MIAQTRLCRVWMLRITDPARPGSPPQPWVILSAAAADDDWSAAAHLDDALLAAIDLRWRPGALRPVTDAMRAVAGEAWALGIQVPIPTMEVV